MDKKLREFDVAEMHIQRWLTKSFDTKFPVEAKSAHVITIDGKYDLTFSILGSNKIAKRMIDIKKISAAHNIQYGVPEELKNKVTDALTQTINFMAYSANTVFVLTRSDNPSLLHTDIVWDPKKYYYSFKYRHPLQIKKDAIEIEINRLLNIQEAKRPEEWPEQFTSKAKELSECLQDLTLAKDEIEKNNIKLSSKPVLICTLSKRLPLVDEI